MEIEQFELYNSKIQNHSIINSLKLQAFQFLYNKFMTPSLIHQSKSHLQLSALTNHDPKINFSLNNIKETLSSKKKPIRKRNYQRRKRRFIVHTICIIDKSDPTSQKYITQTFLLQDKKPRNTNPIADVSNLVQKKDDQYLKTLLEKEKMKRNQAQHEKDLKRSLRSTNGQFHNESVQNKNIWNDQVFQIRSLPLNVMDFPQQVFYPQYFQYMNWTGMI